MLNRVKGHWELGFLLLAFWPVWEWYAVRMLDPTDESWGALSLCVAVLLVWRGGKICSDRLLSRGCLIFLALYGVTQPWIPSILQACLAMISIGFFVSQRYFGSLIRPGIMGLFVVSLPVISSFQFYLGFPLRWMAAQLCIPLLQLAGFAASAQGVVIQCEGQSILVDAPCSGIRMGWAAFFLCFILVEHHQLSLKKCLLSMSATSALVLMGNVIRSTALVHVEMGGGFFELPPWSHEAVGMISFGMIACLMSLVVPRIQRGFA